MEVKFNWTKKEFRSQSIKGVIRKRKCEIILLITYALISNIIYFVTDSFGKYSLIDLIVYVFLAYLILLPIISVIINVKAISEVPVKMKFLKDEMNVEIILGKYKSTVTKLYKEVSFIEKTNYYILKGSQLFYIQLPKNKVELTTWDKIKMYIK